MDYLRLALIAIAIGAIANAAYQLWKAGRAAQSGLNARQKVRQRKY